MEYINYIKAKAHIATSQKSETPVLSEEDEQFLSRITSQDQPPLLVDHGGDAQLAIMNGAQNIALPPETPGELGQAIGIKEADKAEFPGKLETPPTTDKPATSKRGTTWSWLRRDSRDAKAKAKTAEQQSTGDSLHDIAQSLKSPSAVPNEDDQVSDEEAKKEEEDMTIVLERLNLAAVNNRVFSISDETQELLQQFNQVFKDLVQGVPTAYDDLESLLTNGDRQLQKTFNSLPTFMQRLIERLPETMTKGFAPEIMAAAAERAGISGKNMGNAGKAAGMASKLFRTPNLKDLVGKPGAVAGMLRSIVQFLRARFPAFMGMNVLWSLALFVLLFVFWYCYKRGKETRLEKERELTEQEIQRLDAEHETKDPERRTTTTTAEPGASMEDVQAGMREVETARAAAAVAEKLEQDEIEKKEAAAGSDSGLKADQAHQGVQPVKLTTNTTAETSKV